MPVDDQTGLPSVEEVTQQLLSGLPDPDVPPDAESTPSGGGFRLSTPPEEQGPTREELESELQRAEAELEAAHGRIRDNQSSFHQANQQAQMAQAFAQALQQTRMQEAALYQQAASLQPPQFEDPDALLADGKTMLNAMQRYAQWNEARLLAQLGPYAQTIANLQGVVQAQHGLTRRVARSEARQMASERLGADDFDEYLPEIERTMGAYGQAGEQMMLDPDNLFNAYALLKLRRGGNPLSTPRAGTPPPSADPRPSAPRPDLRSRLAHLGPQARQIARTLGLGNDLPIDSVDDLDRVGL